MKSGYSRYKNILRSRDCMVRNPVGRMGRVRSLGSHEHVERKNGFIEVVHKHSKVEYHNTKSSKFPDVDFEEA